MRAVVNGFVKVFSSIALSCSLLILLGLLTWLGTLEQVDHGLFEVQKKYFESFILFHEVGPFSLPLPGANLVMCTLFLNLLVGGVVRIRKSSATAGILITHLGIGFLLIAGFVKNYFAEEGHVTLFEGQRSDQFQSYYRWEIAILEDLGGGRVREHVAPQEFFHHATGSAPVRVASPGLPFEIEVTHFMRNCRPLPKGPMFDAPVPVVDGVFLQAQPQMVEAEANIAGAYVNAIARDAGGASSGDAKLAGGVVWGAERDPWTLAVGGRNYGIELRKEQYSMPFTVVLDDFHKEDHPGINMPKAFSSDVTVIEGASTRPVKISMNEPLRHEGLVIYQASWGPSTARPGDPLFSTLAVVNNPADQFPLYACIVIAAGLLFHFSRRLVRYIRVEARTS